MQLLLAEDDQILAAGLGAQLAQAGFAVQHAPNGPVAEYLLTSQPYDIAIIDLGLPMVDGLSVLKKVRAVRPELPVVILTALDKLDARLASLNGGADDFITKPFIFSELEARLRAVLRRSRHAGSGAAPFAELTAGALRFDRETRRAMVNSDLVDLSPREAILLDLLLANTGKVVRKDQIAALWNDDGSGNSAEVHIYRLRRKLDSSGVAIRTIRGLGYLLEADPAGTRG
ncbi:response regulator [Pseudoduganella albidiflava]|uniref:DNA-binding response regulator n=1 Tax=Pseudoduganella albidiflava TaxID=321983 RepID=A0A411WZV6_9BURK|nr:response regulator transcription factor [Pseudoduganella albidiflava]QBI02256.1 response regulator transcription factor [Pseudoduganella albidiflava]GGY59287.1 DNA-binding response regulator [Pseudoduganella albidiflava]